MTKTLYESTKFTGVYELVSSSTEESASVGVFRDIKTRELYLRHWDQMKEITPEKNYVAASAPFEFPRIYEWPSKDLPEQESIWFNFEQSVFMEIDIVDPEIVKGEYYPVFHGKKVSFDEEV